MTDQTPPSPTPDPTPAKPRAGRGVRVALFLSLAFNLLIVGLVVGWMSGGPGRGGAPGGIDLGVGPIARALSEEDRREVSRALRAGDVIGRAAIAERRDGLLRLIAALRVSPFDPAPVAEVFDAQLAQAARVQEVGQRVLVGQISAMSENERLRFADRLEAELRRHMPPERN